MARVLIGEDDAGLGRFLDLELTHEGYTVKVVGDGRATLDEALSGNWDIALVDIMLPGLSGLEVCRRIRGKSDMPVILVTARDAVPDKVAGLDAGADDYLAKPFAIEELLARLRARLRRQPHGDDATVVSVGDLLIDGARRRVTRGDQPIELTKTEFDLLHFLARNRDIVVTRDTLLREVWNYEYAGSSNIVDVFIGYLRSKIEKSSDTRLIHTVRGVGYVLRSPN